MARNSVSPFMTQPSASHRAPRNGADWSGLLGGQPAQIKADLSGSRITGREYEVKAVDGWGGSGSG